MQLSTPAPNTITQSLTATGTIQWAAGSLFYLPEGLLVEAVFVSEGEAVQEGDKIAALRREDVEQKLRSLQAELAQKQTEYARLTKPVAADSYDLEKAQQALQAAYQAAENSAAAWAEKEANAGSERDALQRELNERQEKAAQYAREIAEKQAQRELLQQEESPDEEIISRIEAELTQLTAEETQNREALAEAEARLNEADAALESVQSQREEAARTAAQAAEQAEQARNDARHAYEKSVEAASETAAANAASATVLAEQIREMESSVETLKKLDEQEGVFCAPQTGTVESLQLMQGQTSGQVGGSISDPERGYQIRFALEAEDAVQDTAGVTVTVMQGAKSESVKINSSVSQQDGGVVLSAALTGSDWQVGKAELTIRLSETEYDCCLPVSALHSDNGGDFVYSVEERNTILGLQNIVRKVYVEVVERNNELAALRNYSVVCSLSCGYNRFPLVEHDPRYTLIVRDILYWETARSLWTQYLKAIPGKEEKVKRAIRGILADYEKEERDIIYLESKNHCVLAHLDGIRQTPEGSPSFYATLDEAEHEFASSAFLRIHKSYLINGNHILQMSNYKVLLDTGMTLKGSRKYFSKAKLEFYRGR